jgi:type I restriction enzyme R subunit
LDRLTKPVEFDAAALAALRQRSASDEETVINLSRSLQPTTEDTEPHLLSIAERAAAVMDALDERQASTQQALEQLQALANERHEAEAARAASGLPPGPFGVFWALKREGYPEDRARTLALEIEAAYARFPNAGDNADEQRQLKAEIYKTLLKVAGGKKMIDLADRILTARASS